MAPFRNPLVRLLIVMIAAIAWLAISNHCVLGMVEIAKSVSPPSACHGVPHAPGKPDSDQAPCCKVLRATLEISKPLVGYDFAKFLLHSEFVALFRLAEQSASLYPLELDTGPPHFKSFAESVLQRSILAHAPPFLG